MVLSLPISPPESSKTQYPRTKKKYGRWNGDRGNIPITNSPSVVAEALKGNVLEAIAKKEVLIEIEAPRVVGKGRKLSTIPIGAMLQVLK